MNHEHGRILVVDDNQTNRLTLSLSLKHQGHTVAVAENGQQALDKLRTEQFDLVLLDIVMPKMDGYQVLAQLKADDRLRDIPVIVISALEEMANVVKCIVMGAEEHLPRSFDPILLQARIGACLEKKQLRDKEVEYLRQVAQLTNAAAAVEKGTFDPATLTNIAQRSDALGKLTRVFQQMVQEIYAREKRLKEDNSVKTAFIDVITHELRSPFVGAALSVQLLHRYAEKGMMADLQEQIQQLDDQLSQGRRMIDTVIAFASQVSKQVELHRQPTNFGALIREVSSSLQKMAENRQITILYKGAPDLPTVSVDKKQMTQAIYHLLHNAIKFNQPGGSVQIDCWPAGSQLAVRIKDTGPGLSSEDLATVWEPFTQTADRVQRGVEGLGLGLTLVKYAVEAHNGELAATSKPGEGSLFGFRIPLS